MVLGQFGKQNKEQGRQLPLIIMAKINEETEITIPLKNLIGLVCAVALGVWAYFDIEGRLNGLEREAHIMSSEVDLNTDFRILWPRGELGSLPDDMMQNARINALADKTKEHETWINNFEPPEEVKDTVTRVRELEKEIARINVLLEERSKDG